LIAPFLGAGEAETLAQRIEQRGARIEGQNVRATVDLKLDREDTRWRRRIGLAGAPRKLRVAHE
jgi:hypothetical protein